MRNIKEFWGIVSPAERCDFMLSRQYGNSPIRIIFFDRLSAYSAEVEPRIEIFILKLVSRENFVLFGHSGHELERFENLVFSINLYGICRCSVSLPLQWHISCESIVKNKCSKRYYSFPECPNNTKFSPQTNSGMNISVLRFISAEMRIKRSTKISRIGECNLILFDHVWRPKFKLL